ncbi:NADP-dependent oxidoreductase [Nocardiopsis sp. MG754419]|uniref:NADP-dependent oxidoreductase n=1 Tax=Nocardiopsis sp. MG754419 TaxID=2259865 RepID=UPI001BA6FA6B|nr:NADP-dependent oxidoreductase [Nocardiopsis sp. MG754419]MBR8743592.1 NADP-dependent oxidoreductase [Nocardiopsis sp. MG754419]
MTKGTEVHLVSRPEGRVRAGDFAVVRAETPEPAPGQVLVRNLVMSLDPYMRGRMDNVRTYVPPFPLGAPLQGAAVGEVVASRSARLEEGELVLHDAGWREWAVLDAVGAAPVSREFPPSAYLGPLGMPGHAAHVGLLEVAEFRPGDVVFVSAAAGAVGSLVGQIARLSGAAKVIGSAGTPEKVRHLTDDLGFDRAFDYKDGPLWRQLVQAAPDGIDVYFDNVGGDHLDAALLLARPGARFALCGALSQYDGAEATGPKNLVQAIGKGITLRGFLVDHHRSSKARFREDMGGWLADGQITWRATTTEGLENAPAAFLAMLRGGNTGKTIVRIGA